MRHLLFPGPRWASGAILLLCVAGTQHPSARRPPAQQYRAQSGAQTGAQSSTQEPSQNEAQVPKPKSAPPPTNPRIINSDAWKLLADGAGSEKSSQRSDAISAVATVGTESRAVRLVEAALEDKDTGCGSWRPRRSVK